ncbi:MULTISPECIES: TadE family type IV pilus minor pilin [Microbacterium]|uniref:TadE family type IV pilus minor pilin n=1 Tax=Microbacterium marmarense TaxID=3122051 RepID=A0ABU8LTT2_9MICO
MISRGLGGRRFADRGAVTAEFAVSLPAIVVVIMLAAGALNVCARQVRLQDATADAARLAARGESTQRIDAALSAAAATGGVDHRGDGLVCVNATAPALFIELTATGCALEGGW